MKKFFPWTVALAMVCTLVATTLIHTPSVYAASVARTAPSAHTASASHAASPSVCINCGPSGYYYLANIFNGGTENDTEESMILGPGTSASITKSWSVSTSWGANVGVSGNTVSAGLNFTVGVSWGVSETCSGTNTTSYDRYLEWETIYIDWYYDVYWHSNYNGSNTYEGSGWAKQFSTNRCGLY